MSVADSEVAAPASAPRAGQSGEPEGHQLEFRVLGPLTVVWRGTKLVLGGRLQRLVLSLLLIDAGRPVSTDRLVEEIWAVAGPAPGTGPLRTCVWQIRQAICRETAPGRPPDRNGILVTRRPGYMLDIDPAQVDCIRFERHYAAARIAATSGEPARVLANLDDAIGLWQGPAFGDLAAEPALHKEAGRLDHLHVEAQEMRAELMLAVGDAAQVVTKLEPFVRAYPQRERLWALLMTALYRSARQADALRCYQDARIGLAGTLGLEPGPELRDLERAILRQDPALAGALPRPVIQARAVSGRPRTQQGIADPGRPTMGVGSTAHGAGRHNLPRQLTSFVGRWSEQAEVARLLGRSRLVTLSGSGGCGKTRLALAVAEDVLPRLVGEVWFVDVSSVADPGSLARALAGSLGVELGQPDELDPLCRRISDEEVLLVLDSCERLGAAVVAIAEELLARCPGLRILTTSREELRSVAESVWRVPGLSLPAAEGLALDRKEVLESEAVKLFVERGRSALAGFAPHGRALGTVARICRRLDGIPLAIELAAALIGSLPVAEIDRYLDDRFTLLSGHRRLSPRQRTLQAAFDASFELLDLPAQRLFVQLSVFVGDFTLAAAEAVAGTETDPQAVARGLGHLVRTSMVDCLATSDGAQRYRVLDSIRQYALNRLEILYDANGSHHRHARYYAAFAAEAQRHVHGPEASIWLARIVAELPNLRAAAAWAMAHTDLETGLRLAGSLPWFFARMALLDEAWGWLAAGLSRRPELSPDLELTTLTAASTVAFHRGELCRAAQLGDQSIALARRLDEPRQLASALMVRGATAVWAGDGTRAEECFAEAQPLAAGIGDQWGTAWMLTCWSVASYHAGRRDRARDQLSMARDIFRNLGDSHGQVLPLVHLALFALEEGRAGDALDLAREAARLASTAGGREMLHISACMLGVVELVVGERHRARQLLLESVRDHPGSRNWLIVVRALEALAGLAVLGGQHRPGLALLGLAQEGRERWHIGMSPAWAGVLRDWLDQATATVEADEVEVELARGRGMSLDDALDLAEAATSARPPADGSGCSTTSQGRDQSRSDRRRGTLSAHSGSEGLSTTS